MQVQWTLSIPHVNNSTEECHANQLTREDEFISPPQRWIRIAGISGGFADAKSSGNFFFTGKTGNSSSKLAILAKAHIVVTIDGSHSS